MSKKRTRKNKRKNQSRGTLGLIIAAIVLISGIYFLFRIFGPNTAPFRKEKYFYIPTGSTYSQVLQALQEQGIVHNIKSFGWVARKLDYEDHVHAGRYEIYSGMSNFTIVRLLRSGRQKPVKLVINKLRTKENFIRLVSNNLEADSVVLSSMLNDPVYLRQFGFDTDNVMCMIIPDTYDFYWNTPAGEVFKKLDEKYVSFWDSTRKAEAASLGLTPHQVTILASIVEEETNINSDKPLISSVYLNRLQKGMRLSADPTIRFAMNDFTMRRVYRKYTQVNSPYNTYLHKGLPPGPICTPSIQTIDDVLHTPSTQFLYFCARADFSGYQVFSKTFKQHMLNAKAYQEALDKMNIH
jgi:peptidoglycan lytic transglycosylase G